MKTNLNYDENIKNKIQPLIHQLFRNIPCGVGEEGKIQLNKKEGEKVLSSGARWAVQNNYGDAEDFINLDKEFVCFYFRS